MLPLVSTISQKGNSLGGIILYYLFLIMCACVNNMHVYMCVNNMHEHTRRLEASDYPELELQAVVLQLTWVLRLQLWSLCKSGTRLTALGQCWGHKDEALLEHKGFCVDAVYGQ